MQGFAKVPRSDVHCLDPHASPGRGVCHPEVVGGQSARTFRAQQTLPKSITQSVTTVGSSYWTALPLVRTHHLRRRQRFRSWCKVCFALAVLFSCPSSVLCLFVSGRLSSLLGAIASLFQISCKLLFVECFPSDRKAGEGGDRMAWVQLVDDGAVVDAFKV